METEEKTEYTVITKKRKHSVDIQHLNIKMKNKAIKYNRNPKILGLFLHPTLSWKAHVDHLVDACTKRLNLMKVIASQEWGADFSTLRSIYIAFIRSKIGYCAEIWSPAAKTHLLKLERIQNKAIRLITENNISNSNGNRS